MSDYVNFDIDNLVMPDLEANGGLLDLSFLDDPAFIGPEFPFDELAVPTTAGAE